MDFTITEINETQSDLKDFVQSVLKDRSVAVPAYKELPYSLSIQKDNRIIGGLTGFSAWGWLYIELFGIAKKYQNQGIGKDILEKVESEALRRGCVGIWLQTMSFSAPEFYKKRGYEEFGQLDNAPEGHQRIFMRKYL